MKKLIFMILIGLALKLQAQTNQPHVIVLGVAQDGGFPHLGCKKACCKIAWADTAARRNVVALAIVNPAAKKWWLMEATPDIKHQLQDFQRITNNTYPYLPEGIFLTHAHMGHYTGLMQFGREVMNTKKLKVYAMPKFKHFLETNGPWSQLVTLNNIDLIPLSDKQTLTIEGITFKPVLVPHRDEYSETVGFRVHFSNRKLLFIPDIDKWSKWNGNIVDEVKQVDYAFLDATFYNNKELNNRPMSEVPHPFVAETMQLFSNEPNEVKSKIYFIHFNHTNPIMWQAEAQQEVLKQHFNIAEQGKTYQ
jgi:pyrroloquinoline quinone biosynthesis protein B